MLIHLHCCCWSRHYRLGNAQTRQPLASPVRRPVMCLAFIRPYRNAPLHKLARTSRSSRSSSTSTTSRGLTVYTRVVCSQPSVAACNYERTRSSHDRAAAAAAGPHIRTLAALDTSYFPSPPCRRCCVAACCRVGFPTQPAVCENAHLRTGSSSIRVAITITRLLESHQQPQPHTNASVGLNNNTHAVAHANSMLLDGSHGGGGGKCKCGRPTNK